IENIEFDQIPRITYRVGGVRLVMERLLVEKKQQVLIRYTLESANSPTVLRLKPFLAFRDIHKLSKANMFANTKYQTVNNGIKINLYDNYPQLYMQLCKEAEFIPVPDWYYNIEYLKEMTRGYEYLEDLFVPGYFEVPVKKGESIVFAAGTEETKAVSLKQRFTKELTGRTPRFTFQGLLKNAGGQFVFQNGNDSDIIAGFPWYKSITRQTFVALPGLGIALENNKTVTAIFETYLRHLNNGLFPDNIHEDNPAYNSADSGLWVIWAVQKYFKSVLSLAEIWEKYGKAIKNILEAYQKSTAGYFGMTREGLIYAEKKDVALTWMNSYSKSKPVVSRSGMPVEINALWYNAICFALDAAREADDDYFVQQWKAMKEQVGKAFLKTFSNEEHEHLADVVKGIKADWSVRPNMVIAAAMDYSPLSSVQKNQVIMAAKSKLLTRRGLRTLSPEHLRYKGIIEGGPDDRELAIHQGAAWPWLIQFFTEAYLKIHKQAGVTFIKQLLEAFEEEMTEHSIGTISEMYNGDPPHRAKGAISQAWNVAGIVYASNLVLTYSENLQK
ncbi:MAG: amylo-alpha-1,6-glucosidase, partial [Prolixibacteraceae bacterium]